MHADTSISIFYPIKTGLHPASILNTTYRETSWSSASSGATLS